MRIVHRKPVQLTREKIVCRTTVSRWLCLLLVLLGAAGLASTAVFRVGPKAFPVYLSFVVMPSFALVLLGGILYWYVDSVVIDVAARTVLARETLCGLSLRASQWLLGEFDAVRPVVRVPGRESSPGRYYTLMLRGRARSVALFDLDDYAEASKAARRLGAYLGLAQEQGGAAR